MIFVSHDRYFLDRIADGMVEISEGEVHRHTGGYSDFSAVQHFSPVPAGVTVRRGLRDQRRKAGPTVRVTDVVTDMSNRCRGSS